MYLKKVSHVSKKKYSEYFILEFLSMFVIRSREKKNLRKRGKGEF